MFRAALLTLAGALAVTAARAETPPESTRPDTAKPEIAKPDTAKPEPAKPEAPAPETRKLEVLWQTLVPHPGKPEESAWRLRVQDDNRLSLASRHALVTLDGTGKLRARVVLPSRPNEDYAIVPLAGGDFLVQANAAGFGAMRIARYTAEGRLRFLNVEPLDKETNSILHDAIAVPDGHVAAVLSLGPGPNDVLSLVLFDAAGRRVADHRMRVFNLMFPSGSWTRIHPGLDGRKLGSAIVLGTGFRGRAFVQPYGFMGNVPVASETLFLGEGHQKCGAMMPAGGVVVGLSDPKTEAALKLRWYDSGGEETASHDAGEARECDITVRRDGSSVVWLAPRRLLAFDAAAKPLWRAELPADAIAVGWTVEGDIAAIHATANGVNAVRYLAR
jgi:hypothetical protein